jgi:DNA-binding response OmpR family regulator
MARVLIVDDDTDIQHLINTLVKRDGHETRVADDGDMALQATREWLPDIVILDLKMPGRDGFDVIRAIRRYWSMPILLLTASGHDRDKVRGLDLGADDYVTKPFSPAELAARIRALLRRRGSTPAAVAELPIRLGCKTVDLINQLITTDDQTIPLTKSEAAILRALVAADGAPVSSPGVIRQAFGYECGPDESRRILKVHIHRLRRKVEQDVRQPQYLISVRGSGYRLITSAT